MTDEPKTHNHCRFFVASEWLEMPGLLLHAMREMVVLRAEHHWSGQRMEYIVDWHHGPESVQGMAAAPIAVSVHLPTGSVDWQPMRPDGSCPALSVIGSISVPLWIPPRRLYHGVQREWLGNISLPGAQSVPLPRDCDLSEFVDAD